MDRTPHQLIKSRQAPYNHFKDKAMMMLIEAGNFKTKRVGPAYDCRGDSWGASPALYYLYLPSARMKVLYFYQMMRVYSDEIPLPDKSFTFDRAMKLCDRTEKWSWPAACAWNRLRIRILDEKIRKSGNYLTK